MNSKNNSFSIALIIILIVCQYNFSVAQSTIAANKVGVVILKPIAVSQISTLNFGAMTVAANTPGTCVLSTDGTRIAIDGVNLSSQSPIASNASYIVTGSEGAIYSITLPYAITVSETIAGAATMTISDLHTRPESKDSDGLIGKLDDFGADSFTIGGTLSVAASQLIGTYSGTFDVTIAYN
jgi:hypothetical protein